MAQKKKTKAASKDPNMIGHTGSAPESDNSNDGLWPGLKYQRGHTGEDNCGYCLPVITVPNDPDDYSN